MGRIRSVKPELVHSSQIAERTDTARILYYALLAEVDDWGRAQASPRYLHGVAFWGRPRSIRTVTDALAELVAANIVVTYESGGGHYLFIVGWGDQGSILYQVVKRKQPSSLPAPIAVRAPTTHPPITHTAPPDHDHDLEQDHEHDHDRCAALRPAPRAPHKSPSLKAPKAKIPAPPDLQKAIDAFHVAYRSANAGAKPTWGAKQVGQLKALVTKHSADEVTRRIGVLASAPPIFLRGSSWDVGTLVQHFDKLAAPATERATQSRESPTDTALAMVREAEERARRGARAADPFGDIPHAAEAAS